MAEVELPNSPAREVVGVFGDAVALEAAIVELRASGFEEAQLSLLAGERTIVEKLGHKYEKVEELEDDPAAPRVRYHSKGATKTALLGALASIGAVATAGAIFAAGGALAATLGSGVIGAEAGGFIGGVLGDYVEARHAKYLEEQLNHGGLLLFVRIADRGQEDAAKRILLSHSGRDVHAHAVAPRS